LFATAFVVFRGVNKGIESFSTIIMPALILLVIGISIFSLTLSHKDDANTTRTGLEGFMIYVIPDVSKITVSSFLSAVVDAMGQLFYSLSVAMGIMITYGSYVRDEDNLGKSINQIEIFDTVVAFLAGVMIVPAVYVFSGTEGLSASGPSLMFVSLPNVFKAMGPAGNVIGCLFFAMVLFAALTSSVSLLEAIVSCFIDKFKISRVKSVSVVTIITLVLGVVVCLGYNFWYFDFTLPNGSVGQILDIMDYISNSVLMPVVAIGTCLLIGWIVKPKTVIEEVEKNGVRMGRKTLYVVMVKFVVPLLLLVLLLKSLGLKIFN
jgi:NSS family neurotransmitter:Na+ symporter